MDLVGGVLLGALGPVCCLAQYVVWNSVSFCTVFRFVQCFVLYSVLLGNVLLGNLLRIIF